MTEQIDLGPAVARLQALVGAIPSDALGRATPCREYTVGDLLDHVHRAARGFTAAAVKAPVAGPRSVDGANLGDDWRDRISADLDALADAWRDPSAWTGMTAAGGVDLPGDLAGAVALDELVIHGWDLAKATGMAAGYDGPGLDTVLATVQHFRSARVDGLFGTAVDVPDDAPLLDRILGITGRDPDWQPPTA
jgi:uncharacterized protein (TIGR03086 family)